MDCQFLDNVHCTDLRSYKNGMPDDPNSRYLCTLGLAGFIPKWCKEYPREKKEGKLKKLLSKLKGVL